MSTPPSTDWCLARVVERARACVLNETPAYLSRITATDSSHTTLPRLYPDKIPGLVQAHPGRSDDMPYDRSTPSVYVDAASTQIIEADATQWYMVRTTLSIRVICTEADAGTDDPAIFQNVLTAYADAINYALNEHYITDEYGRVGGAVEGRVQRIQYSPITRAPDSSAYMRTLEVQFSVVHRQLHTLPAP